MVGNNKKMSKGMLYGVHENGYTVFARKYIYSKSAKMFILDYATPITFDHLKTAFSFCYGQARLRARLEHQVRKTVGTCYYQYEIPGGLLIETDCMDDTTWILSKTEWCEECSTLIYEHKPQ